jgi:hypothetical protein
MEGEERAAGGGAAVAAPSTSSRKGPLSARSTRSSANGSRKSKPGVELSNALDDECTVIRRAKRASPRAERAARRVRAAHSQGSHRRALRYADARSCAPRGARGAEAPSRARLRAPRASSAAGAAARVVRSRAAACSLHPGGNGRARPKRGLRRLVCARRVACEDRPGLLLDLTEHLKAQQVRAGAAPRARGLWRVARACVVLRRPRTVGDAGCAGRRRCAAGWALTARVLLDARS